VAIHDIVPGPGIDHGAAVFNRQSDIDSVGAVAAEDLSTLRVAHHNPLRPASALLIDNGRIAATADLAAGTFHLYPVETRSAIDIPTPGNPFVAGYPIRIHGELVRTSAYPINTLRLLWRGAVGGGDHVGALEPDDHVIPSRSGQHVVARCADDRRGQPEALRDWLGGPGQRTAAGPRGTCRDQRQN
jgi:hypothetical protein